MAPKKRGDVDIFFPEKGQSNLIMEAQAVCIHCPVRQECDEYQQLTESSYGIWAAKYQNGNR